MSWHAKARRLGAWLLVFAMSACIADTPAGQPLPPGPSGRAPDAPTLTIGVDLPFSSLGTDVSDDTWNAMMLYLERVGGRAGKYQVRLTRYDNAPPPNSTWDDTECRRNAERHVATAGEVAVIGTSFAGCSKVQVPLLNRAPGGPLLMVSHTETNPGLTKSWEPGEPAAFAPSGNRSFARVVPTTDVQGVAAARFAATNLAVKKCFVLHDGQTYGTALAAAFTAEAGRQGIKVIGQAQWRRDAENYFDIWDRVRPSAADCVFLGGIFDNNGAHLVKEKAEAVGDNERVRLLAPDGFAGYPELQGMLYADGMYLTGTGLPLATISGTPVAGPFLAAFRVRHQRNPLTARALYGVQALQVVLAAIESSDGTRADVRNQVFEGAGVTIDAGRAILGRPVTINPTTGDTGATDVTISRIRNNAEVVVTTVAL